VHSEITYTQITVMRNSNAFYTIIYVNYIAYSLHIIPKCILEVGCMVTQSREEKVVHIRKGEILEKGKM